MLGNPRVLEGGHGDETGTAWRYAEMMWAYFTFLDAGSLHKTPDQHRILHRASLVSWTPMHSKYAGFLHDEINRYIRLQCDNDNEPLSRGMLKN